MITIKTLVLDNVRYLDQAAQLVGSLSDHHYSQPAPLNLGSSVGAHLRHCLDHYDCFLSGLGVGYIDYDARVREPRLEHSRDAALHKLHDQMIRLRAAADLADKVVHVTMDCGGETSPPPEPSASSVRRELQFLISHTVHHFALIKMILMAGGIEVGAEFGMAPSTLRYHQGATACAH